MIDMISALASWIAERTLVDWMLFGAVVLAVMACGMTIAMYMITGVSRRDDEDGLDFYRPGDLDARYREHEGWF